MKKVRLHIVKPIKGAKPLWKAEMGRKLAGEEEQDRGNRHYWDDYVERALLVRDTVIGKEILKRCCGR